MSKDKTNFRMRSDAVIYHHLFKATDAHFKKNLSWISKQPRIDLVTHNHHFHSVNSMGMPQKYTNQVGGHFHEITWEVGKDGVPVAKCGPPLRKVPKKTKTVIEQVKYEKEDNEWDVDNHTHSMVYLYTDKISLQSIQNIQQKNAAVVQAASNAKFENSEVKMEEAGDRQ